MRVEEKPGKREESVREEKEVSREREERPFRVDSFWPLGELLAWGEGAVVRQRFGIAVCGRGANGFLRDRR